MEGETTFLAVLRPVVRGIGMILLGPILFLAVVGGLIVLGVKVWRSRGEPDQEGGLDLIPYLILALAVVVAGFSLARLTRASLTPDRLAGRPIGELAGALAGLVVAGPIVFVLWRVQAKKRTGFIRNPGWPIYLAAIEAVFLSTFFVSVGQFADAVTNTALTPQWTDLVVYGGIVGFHWWAAIRETPFGDVGELPRLIGSAVSAVVLTVGATGTLTWLLSEAYESLGGSVTVPEPAITLALLVTAGPVWAWRWLPVWEGEPGVLRNVYLAGVTALSLLMTIAASVTIISVLISFLAGQADPAERHFDIYPAALSFAIVGGALWIHHRGRIGDERGGALRGYQYAVAATGLAALIGFVVALVDLVFSPRLAGGDTGQALIALGCSVVAAGAVWAWFWRKVQAAPRADEIRCLPRRMYLLGMAVITGLTAAGALIALLVVVFRAVLGEGEDVFDSLRIPATLTVASGLAAWHLFT
ncbi:MAG TPA: DUF5671 domain-containing protein, partial [Acidimicrobiia bacterium]|nr:DUF5671 domain-containing protein [Acidimicrobiia bacterium]